jgi:hypothetical protein
MNPEDEQLWLDALAGRARGQDTAPGAREASELRKAMLAHHTEAVTDVPAADAAREAELIARARREGLIRSPQAPGSKHDPDRRAARFASFPGRRGGLAVAAVAALAIGLGLFLRTTTEVETVRSSPDGIVRLESTDPTALKRALIEDLRAASVVAEGYEMLGRQGVDAELPQPLAPEVRQVLEKYRIEPPINGLLRVEITMPEAQ